MACHQGKLSGGRWCAWVWISPPPRTLQGVMTLSISESAVPDNGAVGNPVLCPHCRCFGSYFDVIFLMYLVSSGFSFKPTSSSSSSTQFSQEWARRKVVIKHSIKSKIKSYFDVIFLMYLVSSGFSLFKPTSSCSSSSSSTQFSQEWARRKVVVKHSIKSKIKSYFDVIFLMYLVSSGFSFKPTSSSSIILINPV